MTLERWTPALVATLAFVAALILQGQGPVGALMARIDLDAVLYGALGMFALGASLTLGLFALVLSPRDGFIGRLHGTAAYQVFGQYVARAFMLSLLGLAATGLMLSRESLALLRPLGSLLPVWWAIVAGALASIVRTHAIFLIWMRSPVPAVAEPLPIHQAIRFDPPVHATNPTLDTRTPQLEQVG